MSWTESVGVTLMKRDLSSMTLRAPNFQLVHFTILQIFPFTSETKRMGIIVRVSVCKCLFFFHIIYSLAYVPSLNCLSGLV